MHTNKYTQICTRGNTQQCMLSLSHTHTRTRARAHTHTHTHTQTHTHTHTHRFNKYLFRASGETVVNIASYLSHCRLPNLIWVFSDTFQEVLKVWHRNLFDLLSQSRQVFSHDLTEPVLADPAEGTQQFKVTVQPSITFRFNISNMIWNLGFSIRKTSYVVYMFLDEYIWNYKRQGITASLATQVCFTGMK